MNTFHRLYQVREELLASGENPNSELMLDIEALFEEKMQRILAGNVGEKLVETERFLVDLCEKRLLSVKNDDK